jgi:hypothetical protein
MAPLRSVLLQKARNQGRSPPRHRLAAPSAMRFCIVGKSYKRFLDLAGINQGVHSFVSHARGHAMVWLVQLDPIDLFEKFATFRFTSGCHS